LTELTGSEIPESFCVFHDAITHSPAALKHLIGHISALHLLLLQAVTTKVFLGPPKIALKLSKDAGVFVARGLKRVVRRSKGILKRKADDLFDAIKRSDEDIIRRRGDGSLCPIATLHFQYVPLSPVEEFLNELNELVLPSAYAQGPCSKIGRFTAEQLANQRRFLNPAGKFVKGVMVARKRGMLPKHDKNLVKLAEDLENIIVMRNSKEEAYTHLVNQAGKKAKPLPVKAKTLSASDPYLNNPANAGLSAANPQSDSVRKMLKATDGISDDELKDLYLDYLVEMADKGYAIGIPGPPNNNPLFPYDEYLEVLSTRNLEATSDLDCLVRDAKGNVFYSDYDLHGVYDMNGKSAWNLSNQDEMLEKFEEAMETDSKNRFVQHSPHDCWPLRLDTSDANSGPQINEGQSLTVYVPVEENNVIQEVRKLHLDTLEDMIDFYTAFGIDWIKLYGTGRAGNFDGARANFCDE
jgi:hypothetical protein